MGIVQDPHQGMPCSSLEYFQSLTDLYIQYEGQEWTGTDADTVYQCFKCEPVETFEYLIGPKSGSVGAPRHTDLSASPNVDDVNASVYTEGM